MARILNEQARAAKQQEILRAARDLIFAKGYERVSIQDILDTLSISKGAFYHYYPSKPALLEALIAWSQEEVDQAFHAIVIDKSLTAVEKIRRFFAALDQSRFAHQTFIVDLLRVWLSDDNAVVRSKVDDLVIRRRAPLLTAIVHQGVREGVFTTPFPDHAGLVLLSITDGMGMALIKRMLAADTAGRSRAVNDIIALSAATADAVERVLGSTVPLMMRPDAVAVYGWLKRLDDPKGRK